MSDSDFVRDSQSSLMLPASLAHERGKAAPLTVPNVETATVTTSASAPDLFLPTLFEPLGEDLGPLIHLFTVEALRDAYQRNRTQGPRNKLDRDQVQLLLKGLFGLGTLRRCGLPADWNNRLELLKQQHANFAEVIDFLQREFSLAEVSNQPARLPAMLLDGPPGCGKTYFADALSKAMGTGFLRINLETGQSAAELTGTAAYWSNSQPGRLFDLMVNAADANPVVLLDEVDKAGGHREHSVERALYALLDAGSARQWVDLCLPSLKLNLSYVVWILTSNNRKVVPAPLLSRMQIFQVREPSRAEAIALARRIFESTASELARLDFSPELPTTLAAMLSVYPLRVIHRLCRALVAAAVKDQRLMVEARDFATVRADRAALEAFAASGIEPGHTRH